MVQAIGSKTNKQQNRKLKDIIMTTTKVNPETVAEVKPETEATTEVEYSDAVKTLLADASVAVDTRIQTLMESVDKVSVTEASKWSKLILHCVEKEYSLPVADDASKEDKAKAKHGRDIILKSLLKAGKTEKSAQSIRSFILKMSKPENAEALAKMNKGEMSVREARVYGRTPQANPAKTGATKYTEFVNSAARYGYNLNYTLQSFLEDCEKAFKEYAEKIATRQS